MRRIEYVKVLMVVVGLMVAGGGAVWGAAGDVLWQLQYSVPDGIYVANQSPAIADDGTIYIGGLAPNTFYAVNPDGTIKWSINSIGEDDNYSAVIGWDGTIYLQTDGLYALTPDGILKWNYASSNRTPALNIDGSIIVVSSSYVKALDSDGVSLWDCKLSNEYIALSTPSIGSDGSIYVISDSKKLYSISKDGELQWSYSCDRVVDRGTRWNSPYPSPSVHTNGTVYAPLNDGLYALNHYGEMIWKHSIVADKFFPVSNPAIDVDNTIYYAVTVPGDEDGDSILYALNEDGTKKWQYSMNYVENSPLIGKDGTIYCGPLYAMNPDGTLKWKSEEHCRFSSNSISDDGVLYVDALYKGLYAIDTGTNAGLADSPWPKFQCNNKNTGRKSELYFAEIPGGDVTDTGWWRDTDYVEPFYMSITETTNAQYAEFLNEAYTAGDISIRENNVYPTSGIYKDISLINLNYYRDGNNKTWINFDGDSFSVPEDKENWPVTVEWHGARSYAIYYGYDLPTYAEQYHAMRGGKRYDYATDDGTISPDKANYGDIIGHPVDVGSYPPNPYGLYDLSGNLVEYTREAHDFWGGDYYHASINCKAGQYIYYPQDITTYNYSHDKRGFRVIYRDKVSLIYPQGGEKLSPDMTMEIIWQPRNGKLDIEYTTDGGFTYTPIISDINALDGRLYWTIPDVESSQCSIRLVNVDNRQNTDECGDFTIVKSDNIVSPNGIDMVLIPYGSFDMGLNGYDDEEIPVHEVSINLFQIGKYEITQEQYEAVMNENPSFFSENPDLPVTRVSWYDAVRFCNRLSDLLSYDRCYNENTWECDFSKNGFRLPTEAEWEYACRAGSSTVYYYDGTHHESDNYGWFSQNSLDYLHPVGQKIPNNWDIFDTIGSVAEWCNDWYEKDYYSVSSSVDPIGPETGSNKTVRGGSYTDWYNNNNSAERYDRNPQQNNSDTGFRVVRRDTRTIQGKILDENGSPIQFASVQITGAVTDTTVTTDATGTYTLSGWLGGDYTVRPTAIGAAFSPVSSDISIAFDDVTDADFTATVDEKYIIEHGITLAAIPAGSFEMGSNDGEENVKPVHTVSLDGFLMSATEVTQGQYESVMGENPSNFTGNLNLPVDSVDWTDMLSFCNSLSSKYGLEPCYDTASWICDFSKNGYRLPTEAEWEYACRAGTTTKYYSGDTENDAIRAGWFGEDFDNGSPHAVGLKECNLFGLYDMHGNVAEICNDWYDEAQYTNSKESNPTGPETGQNKVRRGGAFNESSRQLTSSYRDNYSWKSINTGFRIVRRDTRTIQGTVKLSGSPLKDTHLLITGAVTDTVVTTDDTGSFSLSGWLGGDYTVTPRKVGYTFSPDTTYVSVGFEDVTVDDFEAEIDGRYVVEQGIHFARIPAGSFEFDDTYQISIDGFKTSATEVTQNNYQEVIGDNPSWFQGNLNLPVEHMTWFDAVQFCNELSSKEGLENCYDESTWECDLSKNGYRLLTEAEWEYSARAGTKTKYYNGDSTSDLSRSAWYRDNSDLKTHIVGLKEPNNWGLYDTIGNVKEWCNNWFSDISSQLNKVRNPTGPSTGSDRVIRGLAYENIPPHITSRDFGTPTQNFANIGFRIARSLFTIEGTIADESGSPVSGVEILIASADTDTTVTTDENGFYNLSGLEKGSYTLSPSKAGYGFAESSYTVTTVNRPQTADITALSYLTLTSPLGGEFWETGTEQQITWNANFLSAIRIEYSTDNGQSWSMLASNVDAAAESYTWTVPDLESTECLIRVTDTIDATVTDMSDEPFTVTKPVFLTLTSMNDGGELINLDMYQITWDSHRVDTIRIEYSPDNGGRWTSIASSVDASTGTFDWTVPDIVTSECLIRLTDTTDANMNAVSAAVFTVIDPTFLTLLAPTGGEQLTQDSEYEIRWDFFRVSKIRIEYTPDGGTRWVTVSSSTDAADSLFVWTVPAVNSTDCMIRITDLSDASFTDTSESFGIIPPSELMVTSPNGGEQLTAGTIVPITWTSAMLTSVTIEYSTDNGETWLPVAEDLEASAGSYDWTVPETPSETCLVRVSGSDDPETTDRSDSAFTILPAPGITVTSPNGGEQWAALIDRDITWDAVNVATVKIEYSSNAGSEWIVVAESVDAAPGLYHWTLPDLASGECLVRVSSADDGAVNDVSDGAFAIVQVPAIVILTPKGGESFIAGSDAGIAWSRAYVAYVTVELSIDNGANWTALTENTDVTSLSWKVPETYSDQCLIRVVDSSNAEIADVSESVFSITPPPTLAVTAPKAGAVWHAGTKADITWTSLSIQKLRIEYSTDNGDNWIEITASADAAKGSVSYDVPDLYSDKCLVRLTDTANNVTEALSDVFTILPLPSVTVVSPNGGESFEFGSTQTIQWSATESVSSILLEYSTDGGSVWTTLGSALNAADGSLSWDVPGTESADCLVRATDTNDANINDQSDGTFSITQKPYLFLTTPNGGESLTSGESYEITWTAHRIPQLRIDYSPNGGTQWIKIADKVNGADGSYSWTVPDVSSSDCLVRIVDEQDANRKDTSEEPFGIVPKPAITVTYPNGGETLNVGSLQTITWTSISIQTVKIEYSLDNGTTWLPIIGSTPASSGSYTWSVIDLVSSNCRIRISDTGTSELSDMSDTSFTAVKTSFVQLTSPVGGENWLPGTVHNISWTGSGVANIKIELSTNGGTTWSDIVASINRLFESYTWTVPAIESSECIIRISDASNAGINDQNTTAFTVAPEQGNPISIESVTILDESGPYNVKTDTLDVVVTLRNLTDQSVSDVSFISTVDGNAVTPYYGALDADNDGDIDLIGASESIVTVIGKIQMPSSANHKLVTVTEVIADGSTYASDFENEIYFLYATSDDVPYHPAVDGYGFANLPGSSWHAFKNELKALDDTFEAKSNALFPFFSKFANWKGRSLGMAASSNVYFEQPMLKPFSDDTFLEKSFETYIIDNIMLYTLSMIQKYTSDGEQTYDSMFDLLTDAKAHLADNHLFVLMLTKENGSMKSGHAVSVYKIIENETEGNAVFAVYDCDYGDGVPRFVTISLDDNSFTYDGNYDSVGILVQEALPSDVELTKDIFEPYTKKFVSKLWQDNKDFFGHASPARMLVTDPSTDNQVGFVDGTTLVNEITGASIVEIPNEEDGTGYAFYVPHGPDYTVEFFGQKAGTMYIDMMAPQSEKNAAKVVFEAVEVQSGSVAVLKDINLASATPPSLQVDMNGDGTTDSTLEPTDVVAIVTEPVTTSITLLTPSGGERWIAGSDQSITWESTGLTTVKLEYSADNGTTWTEISGNTQASATAYSWTVPMTESTQFLVRISDAVDSSLMDVCNATFEIFVPATVINHTPVTEATENQAITFSANISSDTELADVTLYYDVSGRRTFDKTLAMVTSNDQDYSAALSQGLFTALGLEYYLVATDSDGKETREPVGSGYNSIQASLSEALSTYQTPGGSEVNSYRLISVPLELTNTSITDQLSGRLPVGDLLYDWRLFQLINDVTGYKEYPDIDGFSPGSAYWFITNDEQGHRLHTREGKSVTTSTSYQITLKPGWNLIADPWLFPISWVNIDNLTGATLSELYSYEGNWSDPTTPPTTLEAWEGYAVRNMEKYSAVIKFQPIQAGTISKIATDTKPLWTVQIAATGGGATDTANYFGAHKSSSLTWDSNDHVEPPPIGQYVSVTFPHDDWEKYPADYTVDMRPPDSVTDGWAFDVRTNLPGEEVTVSLMESDTVPVDIELAVIDLDSGEELSLFNGAFTFVSGDEPTDRHFAVTVDGTYQPGDDQTNVAPQEFVTTRSFPNPFNPSTTISYELSHQADVVISVYNTLGQMVRKYDLGMRGAGKHDLVFDTLGLTSGIYIYRVDAGYATATDKMMFMK